VLFRSQWHFFATLGQDLQAQDFVIQTPPIEIGKWYTITLTVDTETGTFNMSIVDTLTNRVLGGGAINLPWWSGNYDTVALFDGDIDNTGTDGTVAVVDNVVYTATGRACLGDCDGSGAVDFNDLVAILFRFGPNDGSLCNADDNETIDFNDLVTALFLFGPCE